MGRLWSIGYDNWSPYVDPQQALQSVGGPDRDQFTLQTPQLAVGAVELLRLGFPAEDGLMATALLVYLVGFTQEFEIRIYDTFTYADSDKDRVNAVAASRNTANRVRYEAGSAGEAAAVEDGAQFMMTAPQPQNDTYFYLRAKNVGDAPRQLDLTIMGVVLEKAPPKDEYYWQLSHGA